MAVLQENQKGVPNLSAYAQILSIDNIEIYENTDLSNTPSYSYLVEVTTVAGDTKKLTGNITIGDK